MMSDNKNKVDQLWDKIEKAGSIQAYVRKELKAKGYQVERKDTDNLSKRALTKYKKELKEEAAHKRQLKKDAWIAYKAHHIVYLGDGIYWSDDTSEDKWDLDNAQKRLLENQLPNITRVKQLAEALELTIGELRWLCYHREASKKSHYTRFEIPKRSGGTRKIWAPLPKLKKAQHWVLREILDRLLVHGAAHGFLTGRSIASNAAEHTDSKMLVKMDIENFFPSISWKRVKGVFRKAGYNEQIATLLALLCTESPRKIVKHQDETYFIAMSDRCLPQGAPTSPAITNALCLSMDRRLSSITHKNIWRYTRYADDLTFSFPAKSKKQPDITQLVGSIKRILGEEGFKVNSKKTHVIRGNRSQEVTGLIVNGKGMPRVNRQLKRQMRAAIHNVQQGKELPEGESLQRLRGYASYIAMTDRELGLGMLRDLGER